MVKLDAEKVEFILMKMGINDRHISAFRAAPTQELADKNLAKFRELFKIGYRRLVKEWHPDHNGGDPRKTELFQVLSDLRVWVADLKVVIQTPVPARGRKGVAIHYYPTAAPKTSKVDLDRGKELAEMQPKFAWVKVR